MARLPLRGAVGRIRWRELPGAMLRGWRGSLRLRTVATTVVLSAAAVVSACLWMGIAIQNDLVDSRTDQVLADARRAADTAQSALDSGEVQGDSGRIRTLLNSVQTILAQQAGTNLIAVFRIDDAATLAAPPGFFSGGLTEAMLSPSLRAHVRAGGEPQWWQSIGIPGADGAERPGVVVGQQLVVPEAGPYELYLAYDLASAAQTLAFVQATLWGVGLALVVLIGVITAVVVRGVVAPIQRAAETSARLAAGELEVRIAVDGEDELATLARSFNAMADSIQKQIRELAELSAVQQRFVADVSHELRTPLTTIRLAAEMLNDRREEFDPATGRAAELLHDQVERFEGLLGDLLEISRHDAGSVELEREPTSIARLVADVVESLRPLAEQRGSEVRVDEPGGHTPVDVDPRRIRRIVVNVLGNAIEHGEGGPIDVRVDSTPDAVAVGIRDHGIGMTAGEVDRVFDRFWRADPSRTRTIGGTGLGMSIALGDAALHGGTLRMWSEPGRGAHVVLTLPRRDGAVPSSPFALDPYSDSADREDTA